MRKPPERRSVAHGSRHEPVKQLRLSGSGLVPKGFKPWVVGDVSTEQDVKDLLAMSAEAGDPDAVFLLGLLETVSVNDLIVEGAIRLERD